MKLSKFQWAIVLGVLAVAFIAVFDIWSMNSGVFGTAQDYVNGNYANGWWSLIFKLNLMIIILIPITYFIFYRRDKSEAAALFLVPFGLWFAGLADILFFVFQGLTIPARLPWLDSHIIIGRISSLLGFSGVTNISLFLSIIIISIALYFIVKILKNKL